MAFAAVLASILALAAPAAGGTGVQDAADALARDSVYVDPAAEPGLTASGQRRLRARIGSAPVFVAVLAPADAGGDPYRAAIALANSVGRDGTYVLVSERSIQAVSNQVAGSGELVRASIAANRGEGLEAVLLDLVGRLQAAAAGGGRPAGGGNGGGDGGAGGLIVLGLLVAGGGALAVSRRRRRSRELVEVKANVRDDLVSLGDDIRALDLDIQMPGVSAAARDDYERAVDAYDRADSAWETARRPEDLEPVGAALEEGRWAIAATRARLKGEAPPERRAPCFFDPRHGPSSRDVEWEPDFGAPRPVPACEACALRVEAGEEPDAREWSVGGRRVPYWAAGPAYVPFAGGMFGGGLLPGILMGTMLGGAMSVPGVAHADPRADFSGGGGDLGGFGGGGGDFGGGDFGGGGGGF